VGEKNFNKIRNISTGKEIKQISSKTERKRS